MSEQSLLPIGFAFKTSEKVAQMSPFEPLGSAHVAPLELKTCFPADSFVSTNISELYSCFGVEFHPVGFAPFGEIVRVNVYTNNPDPLALNVFAASFCGHQPLFVGPMEFIAILKHGSQTSESIFSVPSHSSDANLHNVSP
jgi:hypothetical protein